MECLGGPTSKSGPGTTLGLRFSVGVNSAFCSPDGATSVLLSNDMVGAYSLSIDSFSICTWQGDQHGGTRSDHHPVPLSIYSNTFLGSNFGPSAKVRLMSQSPGFNCCVCAFVSPLSAVSGACSLTLSGSRITANLNVYSFCNQSRAL